MHNLSRTIVAILAGGLGTRLRQVVSDRPKVLSEVCNRPFLEYLLNQLAIAGFKYVVLCTGYLGEQVKKVFGDKYGPLRLAYSQEQEPLGTAGSLRLASPLLKSNSILVMNGDSYCETDLRTFWGWHCDRRANATLLLTKQPDTKRYGRVKVDADGLVLSFNEKDQKRGAGWVNAGIYLLEHQMILMIPTNGAVSLEYDMFPTWIGRGLYGYHSNGQFLDIGTPESFANAEQFFTCDG